MLQSYRDVSLSTLANQFPQPIKYESRVRNLQRFLDLPELTAKLLWFPLIKHLIKQEFRHQPTNREQRRQTKKFQLIHQGHLFLIIDRTQWQERNLIVLTLAWGKHAIPVYWEILPKKGNSRKARAKKSFNSCFATVEPLSRSGLTRARISQGSTSLLAQTKESRLCLATEKRHLYCR
jgi:hypothetical protein